ncbi:MAG: SDR family oxidoreductase, partial [Alphaproteobacteria bacterium]|nr:SDR family oxidoreductase [Alphaproteobacteria bacterium]
GAGCHVMLNGFAAPEMVARKRQEIEALGVMAGYHGADLSKPAEIEALVAETERTLGPVEILVNNAVTRHYAPVEDFPPDKWDYALAVNLSAVFHTIRLVVPGMKRRGWGRIVNMASNYGQTGTTNRVDYVATKHGVIGITRAVALELLGHGITCNAICPGATLTPHAERQIQARTAEGKARDAAIAEVLAERQPSRRYVMPDDVGQLILFLCGDAAREMTGTPISIDGGWLAM